MGLLSTRLHPERYQGRRRRPPYFEGWYFKLISADERHRYAVIPGILKAKDPQASHAFVQILDGERGQATYHQYPIQEFEAAAEDFDLRVGPNHFTLDRIQLQVEATEQNVVGELRFSDLKPWPVRFTAPGAMGWYAWVPFMECYHGVLSLDHGIEGSLSLDGTAIDFSGGRGYIEKDWGRSFPAAWIWFQSNHFEQPASITASVALIPWLGSTFRGFIVGLWHEGILHRFATYTGARIEDARVGQEDVELHLADTDHRLEMHIRGAQAGDLRGPDGMGMGVRVPESLQAEATVRLWSRTEAEEQLLFEGHARNGGFEVVGAVERLV